MVHKLTLNSFQNGTESLPSRIKGHPVLTDQRMVTCVRAQIIYINSEHLCILIPTGKNARPGVSILEWRTVPRSGSSTKFPLDVRRRMIQVAAQTTLSHIRQTLAQGVFAHCRFNNTRLKMTKYLNISENWKTKYTRMKVDLYALNRHGSW